MTKSATREKADEVSAPIASPVFTGTVTADNLQVSGTGVSDLQRSHSTTTASLAVLDIKAKSTGDMAAGFGSAARFIIEDTANVENVVAEIAARRETSDSTASLTFTTSATEAMRINAAGIVTKPLQPAFMALTAAATNLSRAAWHTLAFGNERFDNNNDFSSNTFTAPVTGKYQMNVFIRLHSIDNAGHYYFLSLDTSNATYYHIHGANGWANDPDYHTMGSSYVVDMDAGDTAIVKFYQASGSEQTDVTAGEGYFSGCLVA